MERMLESQSSQSAMQISAENSSDAMRCYSPLLEHPGLVGCRTFLEPADVRKDVFCDERRTARTPITEEDESE
jgi:hypothetical protein